MLYVYKIMEEIVLNCFYKRSKVMGYYFFLNIVLYYFIVEFIFIMRKIE